MEIRIANRFVLVKKIESASFGSIYRGKDTLTNADVAVKLVSKDTPHVVGSPNSILGVNVSEIPTTVV